MDLESETLSRMSPFHNHQYSCRVEAAAAMMEALVQIRRNSVPGPSRVNVIGWGRVIQDLRLLMPPSLQDILLHMAHPEVGEGCRFAMLYDMASDHITDPPIHIHTVPAAGPYAMAPFLKRCLGGNNR